MDLIPVMRPWMGDEEIAAAAAAIKSGWVAQGPRVAQFEEALAAYVGAGQGVAVSSCTTGLHLALHALGVGAGDEVVVPSLSFIATANAPRYVGATPVFADVDRVTQNLTADSISQVLTRATKAVIVVHQIGMPADLDPIQRLCSDKGVALIEDAACAIGSEYQGARIGCHSEIVVFSFHPRKILTTGEGGMITTSNSDLADRLRKLRQHGMSASAFDRHEESSIVIEEYGEMGFNFRMTDIQAAVGIAQLDKLPTMIARRRELAGVYRDALAGIQGLKLPGDPGYGTTNYQSYSVLMSEEFPISRNDLMAYLLSQGISTRRGVMAAHREPAFAHHPHRPLPVTEELTDSSVILPLYHDMSAEDVIRVTDSVRAAAGL